MNELTGPHVVIVLGLREGRGFDFLQHPLLIEATLKGHRIEADLIDPCPNPLITTELVWETEKKEVRKLRSSHVPLRIDCFAVDNKCVREKIGFILLSLRSAAACPGNSPCTLEPRWHRLVSVPSEYRVHHPELALTFTVRDRMCSPKQTCQGIDRDAITIASSTTTPSQSSDTTVIPIIYLDEGYIQIGYNSPKNQKFILSFFIRVANNMDLLLTEDMVFNNNNDRFYLNLSILGLTINTKYFGKNFHDPIILNEKIVFKILSNLDVLKLFLKEFKTVPIHFHYGYKVIATAEINLLHLLENDYLELPCKYEQISTFHKTDGERIEQVGRRPTIATIAILDFPSSSSKLEENKALPTRSTLDEISDITDKSKTTSNEKSDKDSVDACGDQIWLPVTIPNPDRITVTPVESVACQTTPRESILAKNSLTLLKQTKSNKHDVAHFLSPDKSFYRLYDLVIRFQSITWRKQLELEGFQFRFLHPKANQALVINCELETIRPSEVMILKDVCCVMHLLSTKENIRNLIALYPPLVSLQTYDEKNIVEDFVLYTKLLLKENDTKCEYFAVLNKTDNKDELLCDLQIEMTINELSTDFCMEYEESDFNLDPIILDDWLALKTVKDLEEWKQKEEILFKDNLKRLECEKLEILQAEWNLKRIELETKLQHGMEKCKMLSEELTKSASELRVKKQSLDKKLLSSAESRENIEIKVTQMLEEEMNENVRKIEAEKEKLMEKIVELTDEKQKLSERISAQKNTLEELRKTTLTRDQTACLLQELRSLEEKFQQAQTEKSFFKQQWHNALKEVHALKAEDQRQMQLDIRKKKQELSQLSLQDGNTEEYLPDSDEKTQDFEGCY